MKKIRNNRNPRYQESLNLAEENNVLAEKQTEHNYQTVLNLASIDSEVARIRSNVKNLVESIIPRNYTVTDAYIKLSGRYSDMVNLIRTREDKIQLLEKELKNYAPDHWLIVEEDSEDNADEEEEDEPEPEPEQQEFDFGDVIKRRPN